ncbi:MAG: ATP-binding protein [Humidesulfovibrio sp.]|uniref:ATP-binding protein n=1 Tax=Humidesulfovibrio sp. TaxID=2910988 RepID=UPI0027353DD5|nr:ATP-binding protein [Humidesulfovibrio sp.]MDP2848593.1 ATP-binding protein [Humidesulfovibrio sp.]
MDIVLTTAFASSERATTAVILSQFKTFVDTHCRAFFDALPSVILALNKHRQVVFANRSAVEFFGHSGVEGVLGMRPGEALACVNALEGADGCGTSRYCRNCGAVGAILTALEGHAGDGDCKLLRHEQGNFEGLDLHVSATPLDIEGMQYVLFAVKDISHEMRRRSMERIFFHDVLNLAGGINGLVEVLRMNNTQGEAPELSVLNSATQSLVDEIIGQRDLLSAETNELKPVYCAESSHNLLLQLMSLYATAPTAQGQQITLQSTCEDVQIVTDIRLVHRVLGNMVKNALEAGHPGDAVTLGCRDEGDGVRFFVRNGSVIPKNVQDNIFRRRFSTKGESRGLGTYSMLLLTERYLRGSVGFTSAETEGTTFFLRLPKRLESA